MKVELTPEQGVAIESALLHNQIVIKQKLDELQQKLNLDESDPLIQSFNRSLSTAIEARESFEQAVENYFTS
jgi:hypothetical protein